MSRDIIGMSQRERQRYHLLKMLVEGKITLHDAVRLMAVSNRHAKQLKRKLVSEWAKGSVYDNRGRPPPKALVVDIPLYYP
jgi:hypothetical protein